MQIWKETSI